MPKIVTPLTATQIKNSKPKDKLYKLSDGGGLSLWIYPTGNKNWVLSIQKDGKRKEIRKPFISMTLAEARAWREETRTLLAKGEPIGGNDSATFAVVFEQWHKKWRDAVSEKYANQVKSAVELNVMPVLGKMPVADIRPFDIVQSLKSMEERGVLEYLKRTKTGVKMALDYAVARGLIDMNPAISVTPKAFKKHDAKNFRALSPDELPLLIEGVERGLKTGQIKPLTYYLIYWQLLTLARPGQAANAEWSEIDNDKNLWIIPAEKMKKRREHIVPLTPAMLDILAHLRHINVHGKYLFEGGGNSGHASNDTVRMAMNRLNINTTAHGFRSLARTYLGETRKFSKEELSVCLAHQVGSKTDQAYDRSLYFEARKEILHFWSQAVSDIRSGFNGF